MRTFGSTTTHGPSHLASFFNALALKKTTKYRKVSQSKKKKY
jgi:hypothetical protein